jgi:hypothetical protein
MLMKNIRNVYREITGRIVPAEPVTSLPIHRPAANADDFVKAEMRARRLRRQSRMERCKSNGIGGWTVRTW